MPRVDDKLERRKRREVRKYRGELMATRRRVEVRIGARTQPGATTDLAWSTALHEREVSELPERTGRIRDLLDEIDREVRLAGANLTLDTAARQLDEIAELLGGAVAQPMRAGRRSRLPPAMNIGWEIEIPTLSVEGRHRGTIVPGRWFLLGCLLDDKLPGSPGFSVQTDAGKIELVSDPPDGAKNPVGVAQKMATYAEQRLSGLRASNKKDPWVTGREVSTGRPTKLNGKSIEVRIAPEPGQLDGEFHATVGIHAASLPWFLLSGAAIDDGFANAKDSSAALSPGHTFWSADDRSQILAYLAEFRQRCHTAGIKPSPALEGLVFLVFDYLVAAVSPAAKSRDLSPKHKFLVLCRTDLAAAMALTPEWQSGSLASRSANAIRDAVLGSLPRPRRNQRIFTHTFGDPVPSFEDIWRAVKDAGARGRDAALVNLSTEIATRGKNKTGYKPIDTTVKQWLNDLFAQQPQDRLSQAYHRLHGTEQAAYLHRGMGSLGSTTDRLNNGERAPIVEYRRLTPGGQIPVSGDWGDLARRFADAVTVLNAAATDADKAAARADIELLRGTSAPRHGRPNLDAMAEVDRICNDALALLARATMRSELWTLVDRVRGLTRQGHKAGHRIS